MSVETFERRVERTIAARTVAELRELVSDVAADRSALGRALARVRRTRGTAGAVRIAPPEGGTIVVGRSPRCDVVLTDPTVSRRHLELRPAGPGTWLAVDVGSLNGTWLSKRRVARTLVVLGDELWLGSCPVRIEE